MVVKHREVSIDSRYSLRVVLSHMVVKRQLWQRYTAASLRVVLSHMVVKPVRPN